jgi:hypothetical protein
MISPDYRTSQYRRDLGESVPRRIATTAVRPPMPHTEAEVLGLDDAQLARVIRSRAVVGESLWQFAVHEGVRRGRRAAEEETRAASARLARMTCDEVRAEHAARYAPRTAATSAQKAGSAVREALESAPVRKIPLGNGLVALLVPKAAHEAVRRFVQETAPEGSRGPRGAQAVSESTVTAAGAAPESAEVAAAMGEAIADRLAERRPLHTLSLTEQDQRLREMHRARVAQEAADLAALGLAPSEAGIAGWRRLQAER